MFFPHPSLSALMKSGFHGFLQVLSALDRIEHDNLNFEARVSTSYLVACLEFFVLKSFFLVFCSSSFLWRLICSSMA